MSSKEITVRLTLRVHASASPDLYTVLCDLPQEMMAHTVCALAENGLLFRQFIKGNASLGLLARSLTVERGERSGTPASQEVAPSSASPAAMPTASPHSLSDLVDHKTSAGKPDFWFINDS